MNKKNIILIFLLLFFYLQLSAQSEKYTRKSISSVNTLLYINGCKKLPKNADLSFLSIVQQSIQLKRFDYNEVPDQVTRNFRSQIAQHPSISKEEIEKIVEETMLPEIIKILDYEKEIRAKELVSEAEKNSFISIKAKEIGITAEHLEQIFNSAYIYIPFLSNYKVKKNKKSYTVSMSGGLIFYHIVYGDNPKIEKIATVHSSVSTSEDKDDNSKKNTIAQALKDASRIMGQNLQIRIKELPMFKLSTPIVEVDGRNIKFPLGKNEGIKLDQPYYVGEWIQNNSGKIKFSKDGFVRIGKVADPSKKGQYLSSAWAVHKGDWIRGMTIVEHPRIGIDVSLKPRVFNLNIEKGIFVNDDINDDGLAVVFNDYNETVLGIDLDIQTNIAPLTNKRQSFLVFGVTGAVVGVRSEVYTRKEIFDLFDLGFITVDHFTKQNNSFAAYFNGYLGYLKKYYLGPMAMHTEFLLGIQGLSVDGSLGGEDIDIINYGFGGRVNLGLEIAVNIDWNIGVFAGYNLFPAMDLWYVKYDDEEIEVINWDGYKNPKISSMSPTYGLYIHYSIPSLSF